MKKVIFRTLNVSLTSIMSFCTVIMTASCEAKQMDSAVMLYVAVDGNDSHPGTIDKPFKALEGARDAIRRLKAESKIGDNGVVVNLRGGVYEIAETFELDERDKGRENAEIVYKNYNDEVVKMIGGKLLKAADFEKVSDEKILSVVSKQAGNNLVQVDLKKLGINDLGEYGQYGHLMVRPAPLELFFDGEPMQIARYPNKGFIQIGKIIDPGSNPRRRDYSNRGGTFEYTDPRHSRWAGIDDIWLQGTFNNGYSDDNIKIESIDTEKGQVKLVQPHLYGLASGKDYTHYYAYNILCELDMPGEYYVDRKTRMLYYWPVDDLQSGTAMASMLEDPVVALEGVSHVRLEGLIIEAGRGIGIYLERANDNTIAGCTVRNVGTNGIFMGMGARQTFPLLTHEDYEGVPQSNRVGSYQGQMYSDTTWDRKAGSNNRIISCDVYNTGSGGIQLGGGSKKELVKGNSEVVNCKLYNFNRRNKFLWAGINVDGCGNRVANCDISESIFQAIYVRGNEHVFEYNYIHEIAKDSDDTSAWYLGRDPSDRGNIVRYNFFYDVGREDRSVMGVYCDDATTDVKVIGNIFYKVGQGRATVFSNGGQDILVKNNIFMDCGSAVELSSLFYTWASRLDPDGKPRTNGIWHELFKDGGVYKTRLKERLDIKQPPYSEKYPLLTDWLDRCSDEPEDYIGMRPRRNLMENNVIASSKEELKLSGERAQFETKSNLVIDHDPGFVNLANLNMRLEKESVVYEKMPDFEPIPFEKIGLYEDDWRSLKKAQ